MTPLPDTSTLDCLKWSDSTSPVTCVTVAHNEVGIIARFLDHYRSIGVSKFLIVDDRSDDGTREYLLEQPDVSLFVPRGDVQFKDYLGQWRQDLLDTYCSGQWVTLPDLDEFLYFKAMPQKVGDLAMALEADQKDALIAAMVDMYADAPLRDQRYSGTGKLEEEFPFFDGQGVAPYGLRIVSQPSSFVRRYPTPEVTLKGSVRERLFFKAARMNWWQVWLTSRWAHINRPLNPNKVQRMQNALLRMLTKERSAEQPLSMNKFALLRWPKGARFSRAPHSIDRKVAVSEGLAAFLHFKFYKGLSGVDYNVARGQHAGGSKVYRMMLDQQDVLGQNPVYEGSKRFHELQSLSDILR